MEWAHVTAICSVIGLAIAIYGKWSKSLGEKLDAHFSIQSKAVDRIDISIADTTAILKDHQAMLHDHDTRIALAELRISNSAEQHASVSR